MGFLEICAKRDPKTEERVKGPYDYRRKLMRGLCRRAKVKEFGYHSLRHFGASLLDSIEGIKEAQIQDLLGHDNRITTHRYLQRIGESKHQAIQAMEKATMKSRLIIKDGGNGDMVSEKSPIKSPIKTKKGL